VLKANQAAGADGGGGPFRNLLVVGQFAVSIGLIICTAIVYAQTSHARTADPGYRRHDLIQIAIEGIPPERRAALSEAMVRQIERIDGVTSAGRTTIGIATPNHSATSLYFRGRSEPVRLGHYRIDDGFFRTMGMSLIAGRGFDRGRPMDASTGSPEGGDPALDRALLARGANIVINELAARRMGFRDPAAAVGAQAQAAVLATEGGRLPVTVIGVVRDTRFRSVREPIEPILFRFADDFLTHIVLRYDAADPQAVRDRIQQLWRRLAPDVPFEAAFSDDIVGNLYEAENARAEAFAGFALLAVTVACLGLFGLAAFTAERRTKEIGIRKVFGARTSDIVRLLVWQFSKPVVIANLIAWPIAWWVMRDWLNTFDSRIALGPGPFVAAGVVALAIATGTVAAHAFRVARANPILALRYE
jgi:putative ABC transport system permease protein